MTSSDSTTLISVQDLHTGYGDLMALHGLDLELRQGECLAVLGPNGAGKSTLIKSIAGTLPVANGSIEFAESINSRKPLDSIGWVPEGRMLFSDFSVLDNLKLSARAAGKSHEFTDRLDECIRLFPMLGDRLKVPTGSLSGGQQQMVAIARALVRNPVVLMLDEPSMGLSPIVLDGIGNALAELKAGGLTILVAEQRVNWLGGLLDSVALCSNGKVVKSGSADMLQDRDLVRDLYLGV